MYARLPRVLPEFVPVSRTTFLRGVMEGRYPAPIRIGKRCVAWRVADLEKYLAAAPTTRVQA